MFCFSVNVIVWPDYIVFCSFDFFPNGMYALPLVNHEVTLLNIYFWMYYSGVYFVQYHDQEWTVCCILGNEW